MGEMSFADYEGEFRELCEHAESDMAALRNSPSGSYNTKGVLKQVKWDLKEAAVQIQNLEVSASECSSRAQAAKQIQAHHSTLARLRAELDIATREMQSGGPRASQNRQSLFSHPQGVEGYQTADPDDLEGGQQMERLLSTRAKQEETLRVCGESESVGAGVMESLHSQRSTIMSSMDKMNQADEDLTRSGKVLKLIERSIMFDGVLKAVAWVLIGLLVVFVLYYIITR